MIAPVLSYSMGSNCFLVAGRSRAVLIDSGIDPEPVFRQISELKITLDSLINTHAHYDHVKANPMVVEKTGCDVFIHELDAAPLLDGDNSYLLGGLFGDPLGPLEVDRKLRNGEVLDLGGSSIEIIHTPGHTRGSICLYCKGEKALFTGDAVFADGVGRTDLPGGSFQDLKNSLEVLIQFTEENEVEKIFPGHGPIGEVGDIDKNYNLYF
ncbi:MBL fold metallo-hydrolase [Candidatus Altiarchaeota archaeon]